MKRVLDDIRVLDFGRFIAAPYCGMMLADMGAEVIRIDRPGGEEDRTHGLIGPNGQNVAYPSYARNKKGITLNLLGKEKDKSRKVLADLVKSADVVLYNFSPNAAKLMGLTYEELAAIKPDIIVSAVSCYGSTGPYANRIGFDFMAQAMSGAMALGGFTGIPPQRSQLPFCDYSTALNSTIGILLALRHRDQTGEGQMVDLSLLQTAVSFTAPQIAEAETLGRLRPRVGNRAAYLGPSDLYKCKDGYVFIATIMDSLWRRLAKVIGREDLIDDPDLYNDLGRFENRHKVDPLVTEWTASRTVREVIAAMEKARIPCARYLELDEVTKDPHIQAREMVEYIDMEEPGLENMPICGIPIKLSKTPGRVETRAPRVGEHNETIYHDLLGYSDDELADLANRGII